MRTSIAVRLTTLMVMLTAAAPAFAGSGSGCSINGVSVPEPSTLAVLGAGGVAAMLYKRFRNRK